MALLMPRASRTNVVLIAYVVVIWNQDWESRFCTLECPGDARSDPGREPGHAGRVHPAWNDHDGIPAHIPVKPHSDVRGAAFLYSAFCRFRPVLAPGEEAGGAA